MVLQSISDQSELCGRTFLKVREKEEKDKKWKMFFPGVDDYTPELIWT